MNRVVDVAVLDEVQLLADRSRGWAFTRALLGLPARTLHVCGDPAALPLLERLCAEAGERSWAFWNLTSCGRMAAIGVLFRLDMSNGVLIVLIARR